MLNHEKVLKDAQSWLLIFLGLSAASLAFFLSIIYNYLFNFEIPSTICPKHSSSDAPLLMVKAEHAIKDIHIIGFARRYIHKNTMLSSEQARKNYTWLKEHATGEYYKIMSVKLKKDEFSNVFNTMQLRLYVIDERAHVRVSKKPNKQEWVVDIDAFLVKSVAESDSRKNITIRLTIVQGAASAENPEGLYISESNWFEVIDYRTGETKNVDF